MKKNGAAVMNKRIVALVGIIVAIEVTLSLLSTVISAPTAAHRQITRELSQTQSATDEASLKKANDRYQVLLKTPEGQYSSRAGIITAAVQMIIGLGIIATVYTRIRKKRLTTDPVTATAVSYTLASLITLVISQVFMALYLGTQQSSSPLPYVFSLFWGAIFSFVIAYVIASVMHRYYTKRHSFEVE